MKKFLAILLAAAMLLSLAACGGKNENEDPTQAPTTQVPEQTEPALDLPSFTFTQYGNAKITILGAEFTKDDWDEDVLRIYYDYTNTGDSACGHTPVTALDIASITQDGQERDNITFGILDDCAIPEDLVNDCPVQPGCTSRQTLLIKCDPNGGIVEVSCYVMIGNWVYNPDETELFTFQIDPKNLMGVPAPADVPAIMNPTYAAGLPTSGRNDASDDSEISIDGWELTKGDQGEDVLRVKLTVTNNGEEAAMPMSITNGVEAYQDGLGLLWFSDWDLAESTIEDEAYEEDLAPGESVQCNALFLLRNDHPVEILIEDLYMDLRLGMICDVKAAMDAIRAAEEAMQQAANAAEAAARAAVVGTWLQRDSDWDDTFIFNADGTGLLISGPEYPYTYKITGDVLTLTYDDGEQEEFTITVAGDLMTLIDRWGDTLLLDKQVAETEEPVQTEAPTVEEPGNPYVKQILGTWLNEGSEYREVFTFHADGTGKYSYTDGGVYEFTYTYSFLRSDYVQIIYDDDGTEDGFVIRIEGDTMYCTNMAVVDLPLTRQK